MHELIMHGNQGGPCHHHLVSQVDPGAYRRRRAGAAQLCRAAINFFGVMVVLLWNLVTRAALLAQTCANVTMIWILAFTGM